MTKLLTAGPVSLRAEVAEALERPTMAHKGAAFEDFLLGMEAKLKKAYGAQKGEVMLLTGGGTLAVESMVFSLINPGEKVLSVSHGEFGGRMIDSMKIRGVDVTVLSEEDGRVVGEASVLEALENSKYDTIAVVYTETSVGLTYRSIKKIARRAKEKGMKVLIDAASALFGEDIALDRDGFDAIASCSQKCIGAPAGLAYVGLSEEAMNTIDKVQNKPRYLDLKLYRDALDKKRGVPSTPAINTMFALDRALDVMLDIGLPEWVEMHRKRARILYDSLPKYGYEMLVQKEEYRSNSVTAFRVPEGLTSADVISRFYANGYGISAGMGGLAKSVIRIGTMGDVSEEDMRRAVEIIAGDGQHEREPIEAKS